MANKFSFQDLTDHLSQAKVEGYGHAYMSVSPELEITWGYCGSKTAFPNDGSPTTWVSPFVQGEKTAQQLHQDAWAWLQDIKAGLGIRAYEKLYDRPVGRPREYEGRERTSLMLSIDLLKEIDSRRGKEESRSVYIERMLRQGLGMK